MLFRNVGLTFNGLHVVIFQKTTSNPTGAADTWRVSVVLGSNTIVLKKMTDTQFYVAHTCFRFSA
jgi:hypothetical protein